MKRRLVSLLIGLTILIGGLSAGVASAVPAAAAGCTPSGDHDSWVWNAPYNTVRIHIKIHLYSQGVYIPQRGGGYILSSCNYAYLASSYPENGATMNATPIWIRAWVCGNFYDAHDSGNQYGVYQPSVGVPWSGYINYPLNCVPQADTAYAYPGPPNYATTHIWGYGGAGNPNWDANGLYVSW